jgi:flagella basal body P-ring formation protein FlgA
MNLWFLILSLMARPEACEMIDHGQIVADDLAKALPAFAGIPGDAVVGIAPALGSRRILAFPELDRFARKYGVAAPANAKACFEWKLRRLTEDDVRAVVRESLRAPEAHVEILAMSSTMIPEGKLIFPLSGLAAPYVADPATPVTWHGQVLYGGARKFSVWVRIRASAMLTRVVASELLLPGQPVTVPQIRLETNEDFPLQHGVARNLDEVAGMVPRYAIRPGMPVFRSDLSAPILVRRGELVKVTVISGPARLTLEAQANDPGHQGDEISLTNPRTGKTFRGRIDGKGEVQVIPGAVSMLTRVQ